MSKRLFGVFSVMAAGVRLDDWRPPRRNRLAIAASGWPRAITYAKDVAPILYNNCTECHRPAMSAPMSLMTYDEARPWARAIKQRVVKREMPPWSADPAHGKFKNDPSLSQKEIDTIAAWVDAGAPKGDDGDCRRRRRTPRAGPSARPTPSSR